MSVPYIYDFNTIRDALSSNALNVFEIIESYDKEYELTELFRECLGSASPTIEDIDNFLVYDFEWIYDILHITEEEDEEDES